MLTSVQALSGPNLGRRRSMRLHRELLSLMDTMSLDRSGLDSFDVCSPLVEAYVYLEMWTV